MISRILFAMFSPILIYANFFKEYTIKDTFCNILIKIALKIDNK